MSAQNDIDSGWFKKAESDLTTVKVMLTTEGPYDTACFHAQQAAEKYLKGLLVYFEVSFPYTHNLVVLGRLCSKQIDDWELGEDALATLTAYAVGTRYELSFFPEKALAAEALSLAEQVKTTVLHTIAKLERDNPEREQSAESP